MNFIYRVKKLLPIICSINWFSEKYWNAFKLKFSEEKRLKERLANARDKSINLEHNL